NLMANHKITPAAVGRNVHMSLSQQDICTLRFSASLSFGVVCPSSEDYSHTFAIYLSPAETGRRQTR
ncbi:MAG: hypothetical protein OEZ02_05485, partial [Anaerolineae bacterium]|nr:hypothetical protein [Anaerolineae bacterium]